MFKPFIGDCINPECGRTGVPIPVRSGICDKCNYEKKQRAKLQRSSDSGEYKTDREGQQENGGFDVVSSSSSNSFSGNIPGFEGRRNEIIRRTGSGYRFKNNKSIENSNRASSNTNKSANDDECLYNEKGEEINPSHIPQRVVRKPIKKKPIQYRRKRTGEAEVFESIWEQATKDSQATCFVCNKNIMEPTPSNFAHILPKALNKYPLFKLNPDNIKLFCHDSYSSCHHRFDKEPRSTLKEPMWKKVFELEEKLKEEYKLLKSSL